MLTVSYLQGQVGGAGGDCFSCYSHACRSDQSQQRGRMMEAVQCIVMLCRV